MIPTQTRASAVHILYFILINVIHFAVCKSATQKRTKVAFGSCIFPTLNKSILHRISDRDPDVFIMTGDASYLDYKSIDLDSNVGILRGHFIGVPSGLEGESPAQIEREWKETWDLTVRDPDWIKLKTKTEIISVWDDHDYGQNDGTFHNEHREMAKRLYLDAMNIDHDDPRRTTTNGVYHHYPLQIKMDDNLVKIVDIILLDVRYFAKENGDEDILGQEQWEWFEDLMMNQLEGDLTLIVSGIQMMPISRIKTSETWARFPLSQKRLFSMIYRMKKEREKEVILVSGDVHRGEIMKMVCTETEGEDQFMEIMEVTSSGLTHSVGDDAPFIIRNFVRLLHLMESDGITECLWRGINFGEIEIEWNSNSKGIDAVKVNIFDDDMDRKCQSVLYPMINSETKWNEILLRDGLIPLMEMDGLKCYGAMNQYTEREKLWKQNLFNFCYLLIVITPLVLLLSLCICWSNLCNAKSKRKRD